MTASSDRAEAPKARTSGPETPASNSAAGTQDQRLTRALRQPGGLLDQAETVLRRALAADPHNARALLRLGDILRGKGDFPAALDLYRRLRALQPGHAAASWLSAILDGGRMPDVAPPGFRPAPFVRMTDFLEPPQQDRLLTLTLAGGERFTPARVGKGRLDLETRTAFVSEARLRREVKSWFGPKLRGVLPHVLTRLRMDEAPGGGARGDAASHEGAPRYGIELDVTAHPAGGFYGAHRDNSEERNCRRKITFVYYFHREPRRFSGGDLLLYDTDFEAGTASNTAFTRLEPLRNSLVFFPSGCYHEVTPVECATNDFGDGRFTVNGWFRSRNEEQGANRSAQTGPAAGSRTECGAGAETSRSLFQYEDGPEGGRRKERQAEPGSSPRA